MGKTRSKFDSKDLESSLTQQEDAVLKTAMRFFADELLPYFHIEGKVVDFAPTELVHMELRKLYEDMNLVMEDGTWKHFEFQSTDGGIPDLKRFRVYEAMASYQNNVAVTTYVLYSGKIRNPVTEFTEGVNTYRVIPVMLLDQDADKEIQKIRQKLEQGELITRKNLVSLTLCPLMSGEMSQKERIQAAFSIMRKITSVDSNEIRKMEAMIYTMADKFLDKMSMEEILEDISMTKLGTMLVNKGIEQGIEQGIKQGEKRRELEIARNLIDLLDEKVIAERTGLPLETIQKMKTEKDFK